MFEKFLPTRQKHQAPKGSAAVKVADLDALVSKSITFTLHGKDHKIDPLTVEQFVRFAAAYSDVLKLQDQDVVTPEQLVEAYYNLVSSVCTTVSKDDIHKMSQQQVAALFQIMVDLHTGRLFGDEKKTLEKVMLLIHSTPNQLK